MRIKARFKIRYLLIRQRESYVALQNNWFTIEYEIYSGCCSFTYADSSNRNSTIIYHCLFGLAYTT